MEHRKLHNRGNETKVGILAVACVGPRAGLDASSSRKLSCIVQYHGPSVVKPVVLSLYYLSYIDWQVSVTVNKVTILEKQNVRMCLELNAMF
jgi:hypothetical protein